MPEASAAGTADLAHPFLRGGGEIAARIAAFDWSTTSLGPIEAWPQHVKITVSTILRSKLPMCTLWGRDGIMIYNEGYAAIAGGRHPQVLGMPVREAWAEAADFNDNVANVVLGGGTLSYTDIEFTLNRRGVPEQVWLNLEYSPVLDEAGVPAGIIAFCVETTAKVQAERWRTSERERQRQMFEQAPGFVAVLSGPEHVFELTNLAYMQLVGHRDVMGLTVRKALPEIEGQGFFELLDKVYTTGEAFVGSGVKANIQRLPGGQTETRHIDLIYQPIRDPAGQVMGIYVQGMDVTERQIAEVSLRKSEARFRAFAGSMPNHVWTASAGGHLNWFNNRVYEYAGKATGELDGDKWATIVHPDDIPAVAKRWGDACATGNDYEVEFRLQRADGQYRWHIARAVSIREVDGSILQWIGTNTDFDEQRKTAQALEESERRLNLAQKAAGIASLEVDIASGMVFGSESFWSIWGLSPRDSISIADIEAIVVPEDRHITSTAETRATGNAASHVEYRIRRPDTGEIRWLARTIDFIFDAQGNPIKMFGVVQDVTDRRESEARQKILTHELEHRIKNLLALVSAIAARTLKNADIDTAREAFLQRLRSLGEAHDIMNETKWRGASMQQVIEATVAALPLEQIRISGPALSLHPRMGLTMALAVNELATNAMKYGALSKPDGRVTISWSNDLSTPANEEAFVWRWQEEGGPEVSMPSRRGFGTFLLERVFSADFGGAVVIEHRRDGLSCMLTAPSPGVEAADYRD